MSDIGWTLIDVLEGYTTSLKDVGSKLMIFTNSERIIEQLDATGAAELIGDENIYQATRRLGETTKRATADAKRWVAETSDAPEKRQESDDDTP